MSHLAWIPKEVGSFSIGKMGDLTQIYTTILDAVSAYDEGVGKLAVSKIRELEGQLEMNLKKDIFGAFGPEAISGL